MSQDGGPSQDASVQTTDAGQPPASDAGATPIDPLGSVTQVYSASCPSGGVSGATCTSLTVACPGIASATVTLKVSQSAQSPAGSILFTAGGGGNDFYDTMFAQGAGVINDVVGAGFKAVQLAWQGSWGWLTGPGGPRKLACRYATAAKWIHDNRHEGAASKPFCASGISAGSAQIAYALAHYGLGSIFDMVQPCSGPPMGRLDVACLCHESSPANRCGAPRDACYPTQARQGVDTNWYGGAYGNACRDQNTSSESRFRNDSVVVSGVSTLDYPTTDVRFLLGSDDTDPAVVQALYFHDAITSRKSLDCVAGAPHKLADVAAARTQIVSDLTAYCRLQ